MNDEFLKTLREEPRPEFARRLREELGNLDASAEDEPAHGRPWLRPALAAAAAIAIVVSFTVSPALRASARAFLDLFRVQNFAAVTVDPARVRQLHDKNLDFKSVFGDSIEELETPGEPRVFTNAGAASAAAGFTVRLPATPLPDGLKFDTLVVNGRGSARFTIHARKLREMLDIMGLADVRLPDNLDGARATFRMSESVVVRMKHEGRHVMFLQALSPEIGLPPGLDVQQLGEVGLRIMGMPEKEAHAFAQRIDWRTTLLLPLPSDAGSFREVDVQGHKGLLVTMTGQPAKDRPPHARRPRPDGAMLLWSDGSRVFAMAGNASSNEILILANSLQ